MRWLETNLSSGDSRWSSDRRGARWIPILARQGRGSREHRGAGGTREYEIELPLLLCSGWHW